MKKHYITPTTYVVNINQQNHILAGSGEGVDGDHPVSGSSQLSRRSGWDEDEDY